MKVSETIKSADWKTEKHVPVIEAPARVKKGQEILIKVSVGAEIKHPNTTAHHIASLNVYFLPSGSQVPFLVSQNEFSAHGAGVNGADTSTVYTDPSVTVTFRSEVSGTLMAASYCNIHGIWQSSADITVE